MIDINPALNKRHYQMQLYPRHRRMLEYLAEHSPTRFTAHEVATKLKISPNVARNELPHLNAAGYCRRIMQNRTWQYFISDTPSKYAPTHLKVDPFTPADIFKVTFPYIKGEPTFSLANLESTFPQVLAELFQGGNPKATLIKLTSAVEGFADQLRRLLATTPLWVAPVEWLTDQLTESQLKEFAEGGSILMERYGRVEPSTEDNN